MEASGEPEDIKVKCVCWGCIKEAYLRAEVKRTGRASVCDYCGIRRRCTSVEELAEHVSRALSSHFVLTAPEASSFEYLMMKEGGPEWERRGQPIVEVIEETAEVDREIAGDVQVVLEDSFYDHEAAKMDEDSEFSADTYYEPAEINTRELFAEWSFVEKSLGSENRLFNRAAAAHLESIFEDLSDDAVGAAVIRTAGPGTAWEWLYRARVFQSQEKLLHALKVPDQEMSAPPSQLASAGRMNARGVSVFYGATHEKVARSEVRPPVGSYVAIAKFQILRPLRLLDIEALGALEIQGSVFDPAHARHLEKAKFLRYFANRISIPVMPDDEAFDYLVTQAVADYLSNRQDLKLDGLLFRSAQGEDAGANVVLFHKSSRTELIELPEGTVIDGSLYHSTEEGEEPDFWIWERQLKPKRAPRKPRTGFDPFAFGMPDEATRSDYDPRENSLRVDPNSIVVHEINKIAYEAFTHTVRRHKTVEPRRKPKRQF